MVLSLVISCLNEEKALPIFYKAVLEVQEEISADLEIVFIDDGSTDKTLSLLRELNRNDSRVHYISFFVISGKKQVC